MSCGAKPCFGESAAEVAFPLRRLELIKRVTIRCCRDRDCRGTPENADALCQDQKFKVQLAAATMPEVIEIASDSEEERK